jgi:hypothetical protein
VERFLAEEAMCKERKSMGRIVRLFAATAALTFLGISGAAAGWYGSSWSGSNWYGASWYGSGCCAPRPAPVNWGCGTSCAPSPIFAQGCCGPVRWGCGNSCGYGYQQPIHVTYQGPTYEPPLTGYTYPAYQEPEPYVAPYRTYRPYVRPAYRTFYRGYRPYVRSRTAYRYGPYREPRVRHAPLRYK